MPCPYYPFMSRAKEAKKQKKLTLVIQRRTLTVDQNNLKLTFEQENVEDTKLWYTTEEQQ